MAVAAAEVAAAVAAQVLAVACAVAAVAAAACDAAIDAVAAAAALLLLVEIICTLSRYREAPSAFPPLVRLKSIPRGPVGATAPVVKERLI